MFTVPHKSIISLSYLLAGGGYGVLDESKDMTEKSALSSLAKDSFFSHFSANFQSFFSD